MDLTDRIAKALGKRKQEQLLRMLTINNGLIDFTSNDYLGLARSENMRVLIDTKLNSIHANGSTGSRLLSGNSVYIEQVESKLARLFKAERTLIFNSGYTANIAVLSTLPQRGDTILYDELSHASIKDGIRLSLAKRYSFKHNDLNDLEQRLKTASGTIFIVVESVYSMDGDSCPLDELTALAQRFDAHIILDEAHTTGLRGIGGSGAACEKGLEDQILVRIYTFGKAMGIHGAAVACSDLLADFFINFARPFIYTTAPGPHAVASIDGAFEYLKANAHLQSAIKEKVSFFKQCFEAETGNQLLKSSGDHPIQAIIIPGNQEVKAASILLKKAGFDVRPILSPTVREGEERLRICLHTFNSDEEISRLIDSLAPLI